MVAETFESHDIDFAHFERLLSNPISDILNCITAFVKDVLHSNTFPENFCPGVAHLRRHVKNKYSLFRKLILQWEMPVASSAFCSERMNCKERHK
eukprot:6788294-Karenia_brevis.AAC.1